MNPLAHELDLGTLGFERGAHILLQHALRSRAQGLERSARDGKAQMGPDRIRDHRQ